MDDVFVLFYQLVLQFEQSKNKKNKVKLQNFEKNLTFPNCEKYSVNSPSAISGSKPPTNTLRANA